MRTSNPALSEKAFARVAETDSSRAGWAAPTGIPPAPDEVSPWQSADDNMTVGGTVSATAVLLVLLGIGAAVGWNAVETAPDGSVELPGWIMIALFGALGVAIATVVRPQWARFTAPLYALVEGTVVGAISNLYEREFDGIVLQAAIGTMGVLAVMLLIYATRIITVTDKFRMGVVMATGAIMLMYVVSMVFRLFGSEIPFLHETGAMGILISLAIVVVASLNLLLDFDFVERAVAARAPRATEWYAAFGLVVTLVWLYLELLRLLAKLQRD